MNKVVAWQYRSRSGGIWRDGSELMANTTSEDWKKEFEVRPLFAIPDTNCVVSRGSIKALRDEVRDQASLKDHYQDWGEFELMVEAMLNAAEVGDE